jgi:hypothetical protein
MITTDRLVLTRDDKRSNLIRSVPLVDIQRIDQHYVNSPCFDIILNEIVGKKFQTGQLSLCADKAKDMNDWVQTILDFKKCSVKGIKSVDHNGKIILDLDKINKFTRKVGKAKNFDLNKLFYDGKDVAVKENNSKTTIIKNALNHIINISTKGEIASNQVNRLWKGRMIKARNFNKGMEQKEFNMKLAYSNKIFREKELEAKMNNKRIARKQLRLFKKTARRISHIKHQELTEYSKLYENQINMQKQHTIHQAKTFMHLVNEQDKLTDYRVCYSSEIQHFENHVFVGKLCKKYYGKFVLISLI